MRMTGISSRWPVLIAMTLAAALAFGACGKKENEDALATTETPDPRDTFYEGVFIEGVDVGNKTVEQARTLATEAVQKLIDKVEIELQFSGSSWVLHAQDLNVSYDIEDTIKQAMDYGRGGTNSENKIARDKAQSEGVNFDAELSIDQDTLGIVAVALSQEISTEPLEPTSKYTPEGPDRFAFVPGKQGVTVDVNQLESAISDAFNAEKFPAIVPVPVTMVDPQHTIEDIKANTITIATAITSFENNNNKDRIHNLQRGVELINGTMIKPGREFSFNEIVGPRDESHGWRKAATIVNGNTFEDDWGGGICQISTTLYNAVLKSDLKVSVRQRHSIPSSYVPYGLDATVSYGSQDFCFVNNTDYPIYVFASVSTSKKEVVVSIYGRPVSDNRSIRLRSETIETLKPEEPEVVADNTKAVGYTEVLIKERPGYKVEVYKDYSRDGQVIDTKRMYTDNYRPVRGKIKIGAGAATPVSPTPGDEGLPNDGVIEAPETPEPVPEDIEEAISIPEGDSDDDSSSGESDNVEIPEE